MYSTQYPTINHYGGLRYQIDFNQNRSLWLDLQAIFRYLYQILFILFILFLVWQSWPYLGDWLKTQGSKAIQFQEERTKTLKRVVYILNKNDWTEFPLLPKYQLLKVLSNASIPYALNLKNDIQWQNVTVPETLSRNSEQEWRYALEYRILDKKGNVLVKDIYHHRTRITVYQNEETQEGQLSAYYTDPNQQPTDGRNMLINLSEYPEAALLQFRIHSDPKSTDPGVINVAIRVYWLETVEEYKLAFLWHRLNHVQKKTLAQGSIYDYPLLNEPEKLNLLRKKWTPIGPLGVVGEAYQDRSFYVRREIIKSKSVHSEIPNSGVFVDALHWNILTLLAPKNQVRLKFKKAIPLLGQSPITPPALIHIKWYGEKRLQYSFEWDGSEKAFEHEFANGLLEISASQPLMMRAYVKPFDLPEEEIAQPPLLITTTLVQKDKPVDYEINHNDQQATPVRVNIRRLLLPFIEGAEGNELSYSEKIEKITTSEQWNKIPSFFKEGIEGFSADCRVTYTMLNALGESKKTGTLPLTQPRSFYDRITTDDLWKLFDISEADTYYFSIPSDITTLRLSSPCQALLAVYNRPAALLQKTSVPEVYESDNSQQLPAWFRLRPKNDELLFQQDRILQVGIQNRPPRDKEKNKDILAGRYTWEDYKPDGKYRSRYILTPRDSQLPIRDQSYGVYYQEIPKNHPVTLQFVSPRKKIRPKLIYQISRPTQIRIIRDNRLHYKGYLTGKRGELKLPKLTTGTHRLTLKVKGNGQFFINYAKPVSKKSVYIKRLAHQFHSKFLRLNYEKMSKNNELLSVRLYMPQGTKERFQVQVKLTKLPQTSYNYYTSWTFPKRHYDLQPAGEGQAIVLNTRDDFVDKGRFFIIPLQSDLPPGQYQIELTSEKSLEALVTFGKITAGLEEMREIFQEFQDYTL
jgi:hypothetical protein